MLSIKAEYENGKLIPTGNIDLPLGKKNVIVTFLDDEEELSEEWQTEIQRRVKSIENGRAVLHDVDDVIADLREELA